MLYRDIHDQISDIGDMQLYNPLYEKLVLELKIRNRYKNHVPKNIKDGIVLAIVLSKNTFNKAFGEERNEK